jgi:hypothetical protein
MSSFVTLLCSYDWELIASKEDGKIQSRAKPLYLSNLITGLLTGENAAAVVNH